MVSWNARALITSKKGPRRKKVLFLKKLLAKHHTIALQEMHGTAEEIRRAIRHVAKDFWLFHTGGPDRGTGGAAFLLHKDLASKDHIRDRRLIEGRAL